MYNNACHDILDLGKLHNPRHVNEKLGKKCLKGEINNIYTYIIN